MVGRQRLSELLLAIFQQIFITREKVEQLMTATDDLNASVAVLTTAVGDASNALKDLAAQLAASSSVNPGDVEAAAAKINAVAAGLEAVVASVNEPVTPPVGNTTAPGNVTVPVGNVTAPGNVSTGTVAVAAPGATTADDL